MIEFHVLGGLELRDATSRRSFQSILTQPRRLALWTYLVLARGDGFHSRESLLAMFWPERTAPRARQALRQSLYMIRRAMGAEVLETRGDNGVRVRAEGVACDAIAFARALDAGDAEAALALYAGELLSGFHVDDAPDFERWLDHEREHLRTRARAAALDLAGRRATSGNHADAAHWSRCALRIAPLDESAATLLVESLVAAGDRPGAIREYDLFARRMEGVVELEPGPRLRAALAAARADASGEQSGSTPVAVDADTLLPPPTVDGPAATSAASGPAAAPIAPGSAAATIAPGRGARRRWRAVAVGAVGAVAMVALGAFAVTHGAKPPVATSGVPRIAVLPFRVEAPGLEYLGEGVVDVLSAKVALPGMLRAVDARTVLGAVGSVDGKVSRPAATARLLDVDYYVSGAIVAIGERVEVSATLYDADGVARMTASESAPVVGTLFRALDRVTARLLTGHVLGPTDRPVLLPQLISDDLDAVRAFLEGEHMFRDGRFNAAVSHLREAVSLDPRFAYAHYRLAVAADWAGQIDVVRDGIVAAWELRDLLPERERLLLEALRAIHVVRDSPKAERLYRTLVAHDRDDIEAAVLLSDMYFHNGHWGMPLSAARAGFERVLAVRPDDVHSLLHLARIAAAERRTDVVDSLVSRALALTSDGLLRTELEALRAVTLRDEEGIAAATAAFRGLGDERLQRLVVRLIAHTGELDVMVPIATLMTAPERPHRTRADGHALLAALAAATGQMGVATHHLERLETIDAYTAAVMRAAIAAAPGLPPRPAEIRRARAALASARAPTAPDTMDLLGLRHPATPVILAGVLAARAGDARAAEASAHDLDAVGRPRSAAVVRAAIAAGRNDPTTVLTMLGEETRDDPHDPLGFATFLRGAALRDLGRANAAARWFGVMHDSPLAVLDLAPSHLARAQLATAAGDDPLARRHYSRVVQLWQHSDPAFAPLLANARAGLTP